MFKPKPFVAGAMIAAIAAPAFATDIAITQAGHGQWMQFNVSDFDAVSRGVEWIDFNDSNAPGFGSPLSFTFTVGAGFMGQLTVVDGSFAGDTFKITNFGALLGNTSPVPLADYASAADTGYDFDAALTNASFSRSVFSLGAGSYKIGGMLDQSIGFEGAPLNATVGALRLTVSPVPEPATYALMLAGLGMLVTLIRRGGSRG
jgi:hypothetical protein